MGEAPAREAKMEIRSFRVVFQLERRLHRIQNWRLPLPYGVPLRGLVYGALALLAMLALGRLPLAGPLTHLLPPPLRFVLLPAGAGFFLARARVDGRPAHRFLLAWARYRLDPRWVSAFRPIEPPGACVRFTDPIVMVPGSAAPGYRAARIAGPARVLLRCPVRAMGRGRRLTARRLSSAPLARGKQVAFGPGQELRLR